MARMAAQGTPNRGHKRSLSGVRGAAAADGGVAAQVRWAGQPFVPWLQGLLRPWPLVGLTARSHSRRPRDVIRCNTFPGKDASLLAFVRRCGGKRVIRKILLANNGIAVRWTPAERARTGAHTERPSCRVLRPSRTRPPRTPAGRQVYALNSALGV